MGEPERRRRRLRPTAPLPPTATGQPAAGPPVADPTAVSDPADDDRAEAPAVGGGAAPRPVPRPTSGAGAGTRSVAGASRPTSGAGRSAPPGPIGSAATPGAPRWAAAGSDRPTSGAGAGPDDREGERGLRGLVGSGSSQVSVGAALRARDAARPTDAHLAEAEEHLVIVRRNWAPREDLPRR